MEQFIYRINGFGLVPGNKTAGFTLLVSTKALQELLKVKVTPEQYQDMIMNMRERIEQSKLFPKKMAASCLISFVHGTACPLYFTTDPVFGGSVGANPDQMKYLHGDDAAEHLGDTIDFTPHNTDSPAQAMALFIMIQAWEEWARSMAYEQSLSI